MFKENLILGLLAETPLHPGTGSTTGVVDLPVQREVHTEFPILQASGLKGALREVAENNAALKDSVDIIFGPGSNSDHAGSISLTDARLLAFPVRSLSYPYVWVTCPLVLDRLKRDMELAAEGRVDISELADIEVAELKAVAGEGSEFSGQLILEEFVFDVEKRTEAAKWMEKIIDIMPPDAPFDSVRERMKKNLFIIHDNDYKHLVKTATQVTARNVLDDKKKSTNLWYEESLPPDCLFYSLVFIMKPRAKSDVLKEAIDIKKNLQANIKGYIQLGGNETVGMGWCAVNLTEAK